MMKEIRIYSTNYCSYCRMAKALLDGKKIPYKEMNLEEDPDLRHKLSIENNWRTVPMIFIGDEFIGGFAELSALDKQKLLDEKLKG